MSGRVEAVDRNRLFRYGLLHSVDSRGLSQEKTKRKDGFTKRQNCVEPGPARRHEDFIFRSYEGWLRAPEQSVWKNGGKRMNLHKTFVVLLALLLAAMAMVPMVNAQTSSPMTNVVKIQQDSNVVDNETIKQLPTFKPSMNDKLSYEEEHRLLKNYVPSPPIPESDMAEVIFSKTWFIQNKKDTQSDNVQLTFPVTWLSKTQVSDNEAVVMLRVPKKMLELDNTNSDSNMITVEYPKKMFEEFSNLKEKEMKLQDRQKESKIKLQQSANRSTQISQNKQTPASTKSINKQVRSWYKRDPDIITTKVFGHMDPTSYANSGETFRNYDEREMYLNGDDTIEFITDFTDTGGVYAWVAVYDEGTWSTSWNWLNIDVTGTLQEIDYRLYISNGVYTILLQDTSTGLWYQNSYNDTDNPSTRVDWLVGSTELDTVGGISNYFRTETNPIQDDDAYSGSTRFNPATSFFWYSDDSDQQYVYINDYVDSSGRIETQHIAGQNY
jgi:hypothetical protein